MKKWLFVMICFACISCGKKEYKINGIFTTPDNTEIYLIDLGCNDTLGVTATKDNKFSFTGELEEPVYAYVGYGKTRVRFILEPGEVTADIDERQVYGTPFVEMNNAYHTSYYKCNAERNVERKELTAQKESISLKEFNEQWESINEKYLAKQAAIADSVVVANLDNLLGAFAMVDLANVDSGKFLARYQECSDKVKNFKDVSDAHKFIILQNNTAEGKMFTDYTIKGGNIDGSDVKLSDYVGKGKYVLLDHWASWCGPCKAEMPNLKRAYESFKDKNVQIVGIAVSDKREDTMRELEKLNLPWPQIVDAQGTPKEVYGVKYIPHLILFAPDGTILKRGLRGEQILTVISEILSAE